MIHAGLVCLLELLWFSKSAWQQLTWSFKGQDTQTALNLSLTRSVCIWTRSVNPPPNTWASSRETTSHHGSEGQQVHCYQVGITSFITLFLNQFCPYSCPASDFVRFKRCLEPPQKGPWGRRTVKLIVFCGYFCFLLAEDTPPRFGRAAPTLSRMPNVSVSSCHVVTLLWVSSPCRGVQKDYRTDRVLGTDVLCWFVHNSGKGFLDGHYRDYLVPHLYSFMKKPWMLQFSTKNSYLLLRAQTTPLSSQPVTPAWLEATPPLFALFHQCFKDM